MNGLVIIPGTAARVDSFVFAINPKTGAAICIRTDASTRRSDWPEEERRRIARHVRLETELRQHIAKAQGQGGGDV